MMYPLKREVRATGRTGLDWRPMVLGLLAVFSGCSGAGGDDCPTGLRNCPCQTGDLCDPGLGCRQGYCVPDDCPRGSEGCPCLASATCNGALVCAAGVCEPPSCPPGTLDCPCDNGACQTGQTCRADQCVPSVPQSGLSVGSAAVRACDVLLAIGTTETETIGFSDQVVGVFEKAGTSIAFSFTAKTDATLAEPVAQLLDSTGAALAAAGVTLISATCFDRLGVALASPSLTLE